MLSTCNTRLALCSLFHILSYYRARGGSSSSSSDDDNNNWYSALALSCFRFAAILAGVHARGLKGNASGGVEHAQALGYCVTKLAEQGSCICERGRRLYGC